MNSRDYERLKRQIEEKYKADIEALERVWEMAQASAPQATENTSALPEDLPQLVKAAVVEMDGIINKRSVTNYLRRTNENIPQSVQNTVGGILRKLSESGELTLKLRGQGKRPSEYVRTSSNGTGHQNAVEATPVVEVPATVS
jgi:hypothetical protein